MRVGPPFQLLSYSDQALSESEAPPVAPIARSSFQRRSPSWLHVASFLMIEKLVAGCPGRALSNGP